MPAIEDRWTEQILTGEAFLALWDTTHPAKVDAVVIGSGAGGAAAALELASHGLAVVILEAGDYIPRHQFPAGTLDAVRTLYRYRGMTLARGESLIPIPIGHGVGGTTLINSGTCLRPAESVMARWRAQGLDTPCDALPAGYEEVERLLNVTPASQPYVGPIQQIIDRGLKQLSDKAGFYLPRNAAGCNGQARCQLGCPTGAKQSTAESLLPLAAQRGAVIVKQAEVSEILWQGERVTGVQVIAQSTASPPVNFEIRCDSVWLAAGTLATPYLLKKSHISLPRIGQNLSIHPAGTVNAYFPRTQFDHHQRIPQGYGFDLPDQPGIAYEGGTPPSDAHRWTAGWRPNHRKQATARYQSTAFFGFMIQDESRGMVGYLPGSDYPWIRYALNAPDFRRFQTGIRTLAALYFAAGARSVTVPALVGSQSFSSLAAAEKWLDKPRSPRDFLITAYHPLGTAAIAATPEHGVCDPNHRVFGRRGLYVVDGAAVPSSLGANPQLTIMALALGAARRYACAQPY